MKRILAATATLALASVLLVGCSTANRPEPTPTPTEAPAPTEPTLRVPSATSGTSVSIQVSGGNLPKGTEATIYRFDGRWDGDTPTCDDPNAETRSVVLNGDGAWQTANFNVIPGVAHWVLVAGEFTTPCGDENAQTTVKVVTKLNVFGGEDDAVKVGDAKEITVEVASTPTPEPVSGDVLVFGPWKTLPEAEAASCDSNTPAATLPLTIDYGGVSARGTVSFTPEKAGTYRVVVQTPEYSQGTAVDTCDSDKAVTFNVGSD